jgi:hypothetical protein
MSLALSWQEITLRLMCTFVAGIVVGINRDEKGRAAGILTTDRDDPVESLDEFKGQSPLHL